MSTCRPTWMVDDSNFNHICKVPLGIKARVYKFQRLGHEYLWGQCSFSLPQGSFPLVSLSLVLQIHSDLGSHSHFGRLNLGMRLNFVFSSIKLGINSASAF